MRRRTTSSQMGTSRDRGAAALEFSLLLPIFAMLAIGTLTFGFAFERWVNVTAAARESSRIAATYPFGTGTNPTAAQVDTWFTDVTTATAENAGIDLTQTATYYICIDFVTQTGTPPPGTGNARTRGDLGPITPASCVSSSLASNRVEVLVRRAAPVSWILGSSPDLAVSGDNTSPYEPSLGP